MGTRKNQVDGSGACNISALQKMLGRYVAIVIVAIGALAIVVGLTGCVDDDNDGPDTDWYISGVWSNNSYPDEEMVFYSDGTGYWMSLSDGSTIDYDYYCYGDRIYFTFYPPYDAPYTLDCYIDFVNSGNMSITWPPSSWYGALTIYYTRVY